MDALQVVVETSKGTLKPLPIPSDVNPVIRRLIQACWDSSPAQRPNFQHIFNTLHMLHARTSDTPTSSLAPCSPANSASSSSTCTPTAAATAHCRRRNTPAAVTLRPAALRVTPPSPSPSPSLTSLHHSGDEPRAPSARTHTQVAFTPPRQSSVVSATPPQLVSTSPPHLATSHTLSSSSSAETFSDSLPGSFSQPD
jgi:hypothetical protein